MTFKFSSLKNPRQYKMLINTSGMSITEISFNVVFSNPLCDNGSKT